MTGPPHILIVEDEPLIRIALQDTLETAGYAVETASNASSANNLINQLGAKLGALITDIRLGEGADGWSVAHHARSILEKLPVIYMTGDSQADWETQGVEHSVLMEKPILDSALLRELSSRL